MKLFTIGFTKKPASVFFELLRTSGAKRVVDVRLNNASQLAGFAKRDDLAYFLHEICGMGYVHLPELSPTKELLDAYRKKQRDWDAYEREFIALLNDRGIGKKGIERTIANSCLLCSEHEPEHCHRRLVAEYFQRQWGDVEIEHLI